MPYAVAVGRLLVAALVALGAANPPIKVAWLYIAAPAVTAPPPEASALFGIALMMANNITMLGGWHTGLMTDDLLHSPSCFLGRRDDQPTSAHYHLICCPA